jgi:hypothetical protein
MFPIDLRPGIIRKINTTGPRNYCRPALATVATSNPSAANTDPATRKVCHARNPAAITARATPQQAAIIYGQEHGL